MDSLQKLAFVIQSNRLQGLIWQALLRSQKMAVILEPSRADLADCISQIAAAGLALPDIIILDTEAGELNPYEFCRTCRDGFPTIKIFLTRFHQGRVTDTEKRWAVQQGAVEFFNGFYRDTLMATAASSMRCILNALDRPFLDEQALLSVLLTIRRQLGMTQSAILAPAPDRTTQGNQVANGNNLAKPARFPTAQKPTGPDILNDVGWVSSGLRALNGADRSDRALAGNLFSSAPTAPPAIRSSEIPRPSDSEVVDRPVAIRRYRGVVY